MKRAQEVSRASREPALDHRCASRAATPLHGGSRNIGLDALGNDTFAEMHGFMVFHAAARPLLLSVA